MKTKDYMVVSDNTDEEIFHTLAEARKRAKELKNARIHRWVADNLEKHMMVFDEDFVIWYTDGYPLK